MKILIVFFFAVLAKVIYTERGSGCSKFAEASCSIFRNDTIIPVIQGACFSSDSTIILEFNALLDDSACVQLLSSDLSGNVIRSISVSINRVIVFFQKSFQPGSEYSVTYDCLHDIYGNPIDGGIVALSYHTIGYNDIVVSEIMADPSPSVLLPESEYIEIFNRLEYPVNLMNWKICLGNSCTLLPFCYLAPGSYLVLVNDAYSALFDQTENILAVNKLPQINNSGQSLVLRDNEESLIFVMAYSSGWYADYDKADGGWSLEMIDCNNPCGRKENWRASEDYRGGTPGEKNSVAAFNPDLLKPHLTNICITDTSSVYVSFSEPVYGENLYAKESYTVNNNFNHPFAVNQVKLPADVVELKYDHSFQPGVSYRIRVDQHIADCAGNPLDSEIAALFKKPSSCDSSDIIINEILYSAFERNGEFVEIYNRSAKTIDLKGFKLANRNSATGDFRNICPVSSYPLSINSQEYLALTLNRDLVVGYYSSCDPLSIVEMQKFPSLPDDGGDIVLLDPAGRIIDEVCFSPYMHFELSGNTRGVSLERISSCLASNSVENWTSASGSAFYATPGVINSQNNELKETKNDVFTDYDIFSPDNDGFNDALTIHYQLDSRGYLANITIFDRYGRMVKKIAKNIQLGVSGEFMWDGHDEYGHIVPVGPYLIYSEFFTLTGKILKFKNSCIVAKKSG